MAQPHTASFRTQSPNSPPPRETVLLVEDEDVVRSIIRLALTHRGYRVIEASDAKRASQLWYENADSIDLIIADFGLGSESPSGLELAARFKGLDPNLKIMITTGRLIGDLEASFPCHFLQKPFDLSVLAATVRRCLDEVLEARAAV